MSTPDAEKASSSTRRAAAKKKQAQADINAVYERLGYALRRKDHAEALRLFKAGAAALEVK